MSGNAMQSGSGRMGSGAKDAPLELDGGASPPEGIGLLDFADLVATSEPEDWVDLRGVLAHRGYDGVLTYKPNLDIALAWKAREEEQFEAPWVHVFRGRGAYPYVLDWMWHGMPVFRQELISVDSGRCLLPLPTIGISGYYEVPIRALRIARLIHDILGSLEDFGAYLKRAEISVVDQDWPL